MLGKGEIQTGGNKKQNLLADCFEAILGAAFVSKGMDAAEHIVSKHIIPMLADPERLLDDADPKTTLIELVQARGLEAPNYEITYEGPDHDRTFFAKLTISGSEIASAKGRSRKQAETNAAIKALEILK